MRLGGVVMMVALIRRRMLGGLGGDNLTGGGLADVLVGNAGADSLTGGDNGSVGGNPTWELAA